MLVEVYLALIALGVGATYWALGRQDRYKSTAEELVAGMIAIVAFVIAAVSSGNVEVVTDAGETVATSSTALFLFWIGLALVNLVFVVVAPLEDLARSQGTSLGELVSRGGGGR